MLINSRTLARVVARETGVWPADIMSRDRQRVCVLPRFMAIWAHRKHRKSNLSTVGAAFGFHHASVLHGLRGIEALIDASPWWAGVAERVLMAAALLEADDLNALAVFRSPLDPEDAAVKRRQMLDASPSRATNLWIRKSRALATRNSTVADRDGKGANLVGSIAP